MIAPASDAIGNDLGVYQTIQLQLIFSIFLLAYVAGPFVLAPLSEVYGRVIVLQLANMFVTSTMRVWFGGLNANNRYDQVLSHLQLCVRLRSK